MAGISSIYKKHKPGSIRAFNEIKDEVHERYVSLIKEQQNNTDWET
jgi:hypothetical protein